MPSAEHNVIARILGLFGPAFRSFRITLAEGKNPRLSQSKERHQMSILSQFVSDDSGQDIAEYAVMLAVILVIVVGTIRLVGSNANNVFSNVASTLQ
jgi:Flp pilus assembly pilin Flp